ncbi:hypothetical protein [Actinomadura madurae]|nr:hypothetical protein [Actinomadura madurae]
MDVIRTLRASAVRVASTSSGPGRNRLSSPAPSSSRTISRL